MTIIRLPILLAAFAALAGCQTLDNGSGADSRSPTPRTAPLSGYSSYSWLPPDRDNLPIRFDPANMMQADIQRVADIHLSNARLKKVPPGSGQLLVRYRIGRDRNFPGRPVDDFGDFGSAPFDNRSSPFSSAANGPGFENESAERGTLEIDVIDAASKKRLWRNSARISLGSLSEPFGNQASLNGALQEIFADFPR